MSTSPHTHQQSTAPTQWTPALNRLPSRPFDTAEQKGMDTSPKALQSRPFSNSWTQQGAMPEVQARQDEPERQRFDELFDLTKIDLFAGSSGASEPPPMPPLQRSEAVTAPETDVDEKREEGEEKTLQRECSACGTEAGDDDKNTIQAKLAIGQPNDPYEQEADRVAAEVVEKLNAPSPIPETSQETNLVAQQKPIQPKSLLQRQAGGELQASEDVEQGLANTRGQGQSLTDDVRQPMEQAFGAADFSGVRIHTDGRSDALNQAVQAKAFTTGQDIYFRSGAYEPGSRGGQELLAHELTHVVQQTGPGQIQASSLTPNALVLEKSAAYDKVDFTQMKCDECEHESIAKSSKQKDPIQPKLAISQVVESRIQTDRPGDRTLGPEGWYLEVEPPSPIIWQGTEVTARLRHDYGRSSFSYFSWRNPEFGIIDSDGRRYPWRMESTSDYPLEFVHRFNRAGRKRIYFRGHTYAEGGGGVPGQLGPVIERDYAIEVAPRAGRSALESTEDLEQEDIDALQSSDTNRGQLINSFQRIAIRRALEVLSENKVEAIRLRDIYDDSGSDRLPRVAQARQIYPVYEQLRERREGLIEQTRRPRPGVGACARTHYCEPQWREEISDAQDRLGEVNAAIDEIEQQYPELHASHGYRHREPTMGLVFSEITHVALRQVERDIDDTRYRLVTNDLNIFELHSFIRTLLTGASSDVHRAVQEFQEEQASHDMGVNMLLCGLTLALLFVPGGAFISAALGAGIGIAQAASSWERSDDVSTCHGAGVTGGICTEEEADEARSTAVWDTVFAVADIVDFVGEAADIIRAVRGARGARAADAAQEGLSSLDEGEEATRSIDSPHAPTSHGTEEAIDETTEASAGRRAGETTTGSETRPASHLGESLEHTSPPVVEMTNALGESHEFRIVASGICRASGECTNLLRNVRRRSARLQRTLPRTHPVRVRIAQITQQARTLQQEAIASRAIADEAQRLARQRELLTTSTQLEHQMSSYEQAFEEYGTVLAEGDTAFFTGLQDGETRAYIGAEGRLGRATRADSATTVEFTFYPSLESEGGTIVRHDYQSSQRYLPERPEGWQILHLAGPIVGHESPYGMWFGSPATNVSFQSSGVETFLRRIREQARPDVIYHFRFTSRGTPEGCLEQVRYVVEAEVDGQRHLVFRSGLIVPEPTSLTSRAIPDESYFDESFLRPAGPTAGTEPPQTSYRPRRLSDISPEQRQRTLIQVHNLIDELQTVGERGVAYREILRDFSRLRTHTHDDLANMQDTIEAVCRSLPELTSCG